MNTCKSCNGTGECAACVDADSYACNRCLCTGECPDCDGNDQPEQPIEARCGHCKQTRPLFLYVPDHNAHAIPVPCEWCDRDKQPLLYARCWGKERELEENDPALNEEAGTWDSIFAANERWAARREADRATCEGIAAATANADTTGES